MPDTSSDDAFLRDVGRRLRAVRRHRKMTLEEVERASGGRWSASALGAYERGYRTLSVTRLRELAEFFEVTMSSLTGDRTAERPVRFDQIVIDIDALARQPEAQAMVRYARSVVGHRVQHAGERVVLRDGDLDVGAALLDTDRPGLERRLRAWGALHTVIGGPATPGG